MGVDLHIFKGKVRGINTEALASHPEIKAHLDGILGHNCCHPVVSGFCSLSCSKKADIFEKELNIIHGQWNSDGTGRGDNPPPVGVSTVKCRFNEIEFATA